MRKHVWQGAVCILVILASFTFLVPIGCRKAIKPGTPLTAQSNNEHIERVKKWYNEVWRNSTATSSRISPWLHDTNFIINNYANLVLDWRYSRVINQGGYTYTEVLAYTADTLEFKIGPPLEDSTAFLNLMVDSVYRNQSQSKMFWVLREAPGENPVAEIITFVGDYQYTKDNYQRFINSISYFDFVEYTGVVLYHDRDGMFIRSLTYERGNIINTIRCGIEGGLDPAPGNRVHLDVCLEILTWERDCMTVYSENNIGEKVCSEWMLVGSRMVGNCWASGGGGGSENYTPYGEQGIDCETFEFTPTASDWQEAGVKNSRVNLLWLGGGRRGEYIAVTITAPIIIGLPRHFSPGKAANIAAEACDYAEDQVHKLLKRFPTRPTDFQIDQTYRDAVSSRLKKYRGLAGRVHANMPPTVIIRDARYRLFGTGDCE